MYREAEGGMWPWEISYKSFFFLLNLYLKYSWQSKPSSNTWGGERETHGPAISLHHILTNSLTADQRNEEKHFLQTVIWLAGNHHSGQLFNICFLHLHTAAVSCCQGELACLLCRTAIYYFSNYTGHAREFEMFKFCRPKTEALWYHFQSLSGRQLGVGLHCRDMWSWQTCSFCCHFQP